MPAPVPLLNVLSLHKAKIGLVHQGGGLQGLTGRLSSHLVRGQGAQFIVNERQQFLGGVLVALLNESEQL
jgi:hypothetical protein